MTAMPQPRYMTAEELLSLPDDGNFYELDEGKLVVMPPSNYKSSQVASRLTVKLGAFIEQHKLGIYAGEQGGMRIGRNPDTVRAPDFSFVRAERAQSYAGGYFPGAPDLAVEVLSPSDRIRAVVRKVRQYLSAGTRLVWIIDPEDRSAIIYRADGSSADMGEDGILDGEDLLPGLRLPLSEIWV